MAGLAGYAYANPPYSLPPVARLGGRGLRRLAEHAAAFRTELRALLMHAGNDAATVWNFRRTEPEDVRRAEPLLIFLGERLRARSPQRRTQRHTHGELHSPLPTQPLLHDRPPRRTACLHPG